VLPIYYDDSLPALAQTVADSVGNEALASGLVLRDASGRLAFLSSQRLSKSAAKSLAKSLQERLGEYARTDRTVADIDDFGVRELLEESGAVTISVRGHRLRVLDRRLVGADWLRHPAPWAAGPPRLVFASLKGGVGRSTAIAVSAVFLASKSRRVLAIDLDLEAPGLGSFLLDPETLPEFGLIDALVEGAFRPLSERFLADLVGPSAIAQHMGRLDVIPALGRRSMKNPADVLGKIARAYGETVRDNGVAVTFLDQIRSANHGFGTI
jgi:Mrp family chromosome partitioning ATPase